MCASSCGQAATFFSASGEGLSQETAESQVEVQSACALNTLYIGGNGTWFRTLLQIDLQLRRIVSVGVPSLFNSAAVVLITMVGGVGWSGVGEIGKLRNKTLQLVDYRATSIRCVAVFAE
jgi:hypothetical protein